MKLKRQKHVRKVLVFYRNNFGFQAPYYILVDGTFCKAALKFKVNISEQLPKYLDGELKICTTKCVMAECESLGPLLYGPFKVLQQFTVRKCGHETPITASQCLLTMVRKQNEQKYMLATQDMDLSERLRSRPGVPLLFIAFNAITLEAPSDRSRKRADNKVRQNMVPTDFHKTVLDKLKVESFGPNVERSRRKKHKGPKGPNPLSCKKKKKASGETSVVNKTGKTEEGLKKRRKKKKPKSANPSMKDV